MNKSLKMSRLLKNQILMIETKSKINTTKVINNTMFKLMKIKILKNSKKNKILIAGKMEMKIKSLKIKIKSYNHLVNQLKKNQSKI